MTEHTERESHMKADGADENRFAKEETYYVRPEREGLRDAVFVQGETQQEAVFFALFAFGVSCRRCSASD